MDSITTRNIDLKNMNASTALSTRQESGTNSQKSALVEIRDLKVVYNLGKPNENEALRRENLTLRGQLTEQPLLQHA